MSTNIGFGPMPSGYSSYDDARKKKKKIIIVGIVIVVLLSIIGWILLSSGQDPAKTTLTNLAQEQQETLRISEEYGDKELISQRTKNYNSELAAVMLTLNKKTLEQLQSSYGVKEVKGTATDPKTDEQLKNAINLGRIDADFAQIIADQLASQVRLAQQAQGELENNEAKQALAEIANQTAELRNRTNKLIKK